MARGLACAAHVHASLIPQEKHHIQPLSRGGPNVKTNLTTICANAHGDVHYLLSAIEDAGGYAKLTTAIKRAYGPGVRRIALQGWNAYAEQLLAGALWREVSLWTSDGLPRDPLIPSYIHAVATVDRLAAEDMRESSPYSEWCRHRLRLSSSSRSH